MTDIIDVKKKIRAVLLADSIVSGYVGSRIYIGWFMRRYRLPCITIVDTSETGDVGMLGGEKDEYHGTVQVDVWSENSPLERDRIVKAVKNALGKKENFEDMQASGFILGPPTIRTLDELDVKPPTYRKSLQFMVLYWTEEYA